MEINGADGLHRRYFRCCVQAWEMHRRSPERTSHPVTGALLCVSQSSSTDDEVVVDEGSTVFNVTQDSEPWFLWVRHVSSSLQVPCGSVVDGTEEHHEAEYHLLLPGKFE